jgi:aspartate aminotransferase
MVYAIEKKGIITAAISLNCNFAKNGLAMSKLSNLAETLIGSEIVKLGNAINERIRNGETIYNFTIGDFNPNIFPIPAELAQLIIEAYQHHYTNYPAAEGILELRQAISQFIQEREGLHFSPK